jgi:Helix-turn-helix domain
MEAEPFYTVDPLGAAAGHGESTPTGGTSALAFAAAKDCTNVEGPPEERAKMRRRARRVARKKEGPPPGADPLYDTEAAAKYIGASRATLERRRAQGLPPAATYVTSRIVRYRRSILDAYIAARTAAGRTV